jgi:hypothetical protein
LLGLLTANTATPYAKAKLTGGFEGRWRNPRE